MMLSWDRLGHGGQKISTLVPYHTILWTRKKEIRRRGTFERIRREKTKREQIDREERASERSKSKSRVDPNPQKSLQTQKIMREV